MTRRWLLKVYRVKDKFKFHMGLSVISYTGNNRDDAWKFLNEKKIGWKRISFRINIFFGNRLQLYSCLDIIDIGIHNTQSLECLYCMLCLSFLAEYMNNKTAVLFLWFMSNKDFCWFYISSEL